MESNVDLYNLSKAKLIQYLKRLEVVDNVNGKKEKSQKIDPPIKGTVEVETTIKIPNVVLINANNLTTKANTSI